VSAGSVRITRASENGLGIGSTPVERRSQGVDERNAGYIPKEDNRASPRGIDPRTTRARVRHDRYRPKP